MLFRSRQLFQNLISNAIKFQPAGQRPEIRITAELIPVGDGVAGQPGSGGFVCQLNVQDNGIGFEPEYADKIFAVFQRLHGRETYEGSGVGLAVCRRIAERHNGTITAHSEPGRGALFVIRLPMRQNSNVGQPGGAGGAMAA